MEHSKANTQLLEAIAILQEIQFEERETHNVWKERFLDLKYAIETHHENAKLLYADMKENDLTLGTAESEGHLRSAKYILNCMTATIDNYPIGGEEGETDV